LEDKIKNQFESVEMEIAGKIQALKDLLDETGKNLMKKLNDSRDKVKKYEAKQLNCINNFFYFSLKFHIRTDSRT
jgi:hypothetical protein